VKQTPLHDLHLELGAKMVPFAGYEMPVHYPTRIIAEHLNVRTQAGLFDVSHMGQIKVTGEDVPKWLETLLPTDIVGLKEGAQRYSFFTTESGGILDDLMVYRLLDEYCLLVNAANKDTDVAFLEENAIPGIQVTPRTARSASRSRVGVDSCGRDKAGLHASRTDQGR
jgi:aminomethyltransferase